MNRAAGLIALAACAALGAGRAPETGCAWKTLTSAELGLELKHQRCDFGDRVVDFTTLPGKRAVYQSIQDAGKAASLYPVVTVLEKEPEESPADAIRRTSFKRLSRYKRKHCLVEPRRLRHLGPDETAFTISPDAEYAEKALEAAGADLPDPPCGDRGALADGLTYFEFHPRENPRRFLFVDAGQDTPLFDTASIKLLP